MAQTLPCDLSKSIFFDILKPLLSARKTGKPFIKGEEDEEVYLSDGTIAHARTSDSLGQNAFFATMNLEIEEILYDSDAQPPEENIEIPTEQLSFSGSYRRHDSEKIRDAIPSKDLTFRLSLSKNGDDKSISPDQWDVLALCSRGRTVSEMIHALEWDEFKVLDTLYQLSKSGFIEKAGGPDSLSLDDGDVFTIRQNCEP